MSLELYNVTLELAINRKLKASEIQNLDEACYYDHSGRCRMEFTSEMCHLCPIRDDIRSLVNHFDTRHKEVNDRK